MKHLKKYKLFLESTDLDFDFLAAIGKMKLAILKVVKLHEEHCYKQDKLSTNERFKISLNDLIDSNINGEQTFTEDYLSVINLFEKEVYGDTKLKLVEESLFAHLDDLICTFKGVLSHKDSEDSERLEEDSEHILNNMDSTWVHTSEESETNEN